MPLHLYYIILTDFRFDEEVKETIGQQLGLLSQVTC